MGGRTFARKLSRWVANVRIGPLAEAKGLGPLLSGLPTPQQGSPGDLLPATGPPGRARAAHGVPLRGTARPTGVASSNVAPFHWPRLRPGPCGLVPRSYMTLKVAISRGFDLRGLELRRHPGLPTCRK